MRRLFTVITAILIPLAAGAQDVSKQNESKKRIEEEIAAIDKLLGENKSRQKASEHQLSLINEKMSSRKRLIRDIDRQIAEYDKSIAQREEDITRLERELDTLQTYYSRLVYNTYRNRDAKLWFMYIFGAKDASQSLRRYSYLKNLSRTMNSDGVKILQTRDEINAEKQYLSLMRQEALDARASRTNEYNRLAADQNESKKLIRQLTRSEKKYKEDIARKRKEVERLNREIEKAVAESVRKDSKSKTVDTKLSGKFEQNKGKLPLPVEKGVIVEHYGEQIHPVYRNIKMPFNSGVTIATSAKARVSCVFDGVVKQILVIPGYNQCVLVQHGSYFTFYCKLATVSVKPGQKVSLGDNLGTLEVTDGASALHFQVWNGTEKQNPESWLKL